ncbi:MAG: hypothetical protein IPL53_00030 [Ignavibacteria bacterium]|nr:hypothetical protein [Ignavibacteria bacterium]
MYKDKTGKIWVAFRNQEIAEIDPSNNDIKYFSIKGDNVNSSAIITKIFVDNSGLVWIGTYREGLILFDKEKTNLQVLKTTKKMLQILLIMLILFIRIRLI